MEIATAGKMQIIMTMFMLWMFGSTITIYLLMFIGQGFYSSISYLLAVGKVFQPFENMRIGLTFYKLIYLAIGLLQLGIVGYKVYSVGLFPNYASDWIDLVPPLLNDGYLLS